MKKTNFAKELLLIALLVIPYIYLAFIWNDLPAKVPTHFDVDGNADDWSARAFLLFLPAGVGIIMYLVLWIIPALDPKKKIHLMGEKYYNFRFILLLFFSFFSCYMLYVSKEGSLKHPQVMIAIIGGMIILMGNYFQALRPNYFIGIRTPWTLENEIVWKNTHRLGGRLWIGGGLLLIISAIILRDNRSIAIASFSIFIIMVLIPVIYSYIDFKKQKSGLQ